MSDSMKDQMDDETVDLEDAKPEPAEKAAPAEKPKAKAKKTTAKRQPRTGVHVLEHGDHPALVAQRLYGRPSRGRDLVLANPDVDWVEGNEIKVPN